jgi:Flp pilus assembly pilin Flp
MLSQTPHLPGLPRAKRRLTQDERGLTTVEYIIILVLIAVGGIGAWNAFGGNLKNRVECSGTSILNMKGECEDQGQGQTPNQDNQPALGQRSDLGQRSEGAQRGPNETKQNASNQAASDVHPAESGGFTKVKR